LACCQLVSSHGASVAIDGNNVLIGAFADNSQAQLVGQAHLFVLVLLLTAAIPQLGVAMAR
jgi:hypothetical protein